MQTGQGKSHQYGVEHNLRRRGGGEWKGDGTLPSNPGISRITSASVTYSFLLTAHEPSTVFAILYLLKFCGLPSLVFFSPLNIQIALFIPFV